MFSLARCQRLTSQLSRHWQLSRKRIPHSEPKSGVLQPKLANNDSSWKHSITEVKTDSGVSEVFERLVLGEKQLLGHIIRALSPWRRIKENNSVTAHLLTDTQ